MFRTLAKREGIEYDGVFDWSVATTKVWKKTGRRKACSVGATQISLDTCSPYDTRFVIFAS